MPTLTDSRFAALRAQLHTGSTSDMLLQWLFANGATTAETIPDAWEEFLVFSTGLDPSKYQRNDYMDAFLEQQGFVTGSLNDRELAFWAAGGVPVTRNSGFDTGFDTGFG